MGGKESKYISSKIKWHLKPEDTDKGLRGIYQIGLDF